MFNQCLSMIHGEHANREPSKAPARDRKKGASSHGRKMSNAPTMRADSDIAGYAIADLGSGRSGTSTRHIKEYQYRIEMY